VTDSAFSPSIDEAAIIREFAARAGQYDRAG
jgi:hypothetical protein